MITATQVEGLYTLLLEAECRPEMNGLLLKRLLAILVEGEARRLGFHLNQEGGCNLESLFESQYLQVTDNQRSPAGSNPASRTISQGRDLP
jgi:hypothetical protein